MSKVYCLYSASDGKSRLIETALRLDAESMGRVSTGFLGARGWMYGVTQRERFVDWHTAGPGGLSVMLEGRMDIEVGNGDRCAVLPGDLLFALDTRGQGHRVRLASESRGLTVALEGEPEQLMQKLFGRVFSD
jgi:hypothetical protein